MHTQAAADNREDYDALTSELETIVNTLNQYANELSAEDISGDMAKISS